MVEVRVVAEIAERRVGEAPAAEAAGRGTADATETERGSVALLLRRTLATLGTAQGGGARV